MRAMSTFRIQAEKETKNCHRYFLESGDGAVMTLYVQKADLKGGQPPRRLRLSLESID